MKVILRTIQQDDMGTFGVLVLDDKVICRTCEDPWNDNRRGESCIPAGKYTVEKFNGKIYKDVWEITNVPGRTAILIHHGNYTTDTMGCVLVGEGYLYNEKRQIIGVSKSRATMDKLRTILPDEFTLVVER